MNSNRSPPTVPAGHTGTRRLKDTSEGPTPSTVNDTTTGSGSCPRRATSCTTRIRTADTPTRIRTTRIRAADIRAATSAPPTSAPPTSAPPRSAPPILNPAKMLTHQPLEHGHRHIAHNHERHVRRPVPPVIQLLQHQRVHRPDRLRCAHRLPALITRVCGTRFLKPPAVPGHDPTPPTASTHPK